MTLLASAFITASANEYDQRQTIILSESQQALVLQEMRNLLVGTQAILAALSIDDLDAVARYARPLGMSMKQKPESNLHNVLPSAFMHLGESVHRNFDSIAEDADTVKDPKHTLKQLSETLVQCNGCHESYRIEIVPVVAVVKTALFISYSFW